MNLNPRKPMAKINVPAGAKGFLGCSSFAAALGMSIFQDNTALSAYYRYKGEAPQISQELQEIYDLGHVWEGYVAQEITRQYGYKLRKCNMAYVHPTNDHIICHPDRLMVGKVDGKRIGVEIKTSRSYMNKHWGEADTDDIPRDYLLQCYGYMMCGVCDEVHLFRLTDFKLTRYVVRFNEPYIRDLENMLFLVVDAFEKGKMPEPETRREIEARWSNPEGTLVADSRLIAFSDAYDAAKAKEKEASEEAEKFRNLIIKAMDGKSALVTENGKKLHTYTHYDQTKLDSKRFKAEHPDQYAEYSVTKEVFSFK